MKDNRLCGQRSLRALKMKISSLRDALWEGNIIKTNHIHCVCGSTLSFGICQGKDLVFIKPEKGYCNGEVRGWQVIGLHKNFRFVNEKKTTPTQKAPIHTHMNIYMCVYYTENTIRIYTQTGCKHMPSKNCQ